MLGSAGLRGSKHEEWGVRRGVRWKRGSGGEGGLRDGGWVPVCYAVKTPGRWGGGVGRVPALWEAWLMTPLWRT